MAKKGIKSKDKAVKFKPPVVTVMGHIDHGKSTLLDKIRGTNITAREHGGITQHIGAYQVVVSPKDSPKNKRKITFIDTPGHEAFSMMRARGGQVSDIVVLVVAANDGVKQQTIEALDHAKAAQVPIIVAINKIDLKAANVDRVKEQLAKVGIVAEAWGGDTVAVEVSAKTGEGVDELLEMILLVADMLELESFDEKPLEAVIIESHLSSKRGVVASVIIKKGTLKVGDELYVDDIIGKVKALTDFKGENVQKVFPGDPVEVLGLKGLPGVGRNLVDKVSKANRAARKDEKERESHKELAQDDSERQVRVLNLILKVDTQGTLQAILAALVKLENEEVQIKFLHDGVGDITDSDVLLAVSAKACVVGFNVAIRVETEALAKSLKIEVAEYKVIYDLIKGVEELMKGVRKVDKFEGKGRAEISKLFPLPSGDVVVGVKVLQGKIKEGNRIVIWRGEEEVHQGKIKTLKIGKDKVKQVSAENECGILIRPRFDFSIQDVIEVV